MYLDFYKLKAYPFSQALNIDFYYQLQSHQEALDVLLVSLGMNDGIIKITGAPGSGKTFVCRILLEKLDDTHKAIFLPDPHLSQMELMQTLADELDIHNAAINDKVKLSKQINQALFTLKNNKKKVILLFDEAQGLSDDTLEFIRILSNLENGKEKLLQLVLIGGEELDRRLEDPELSHFAQRITFTYTLLPMNKDDISQYIKHRLSCVSDRKDEFIKITPDASKLLHKSTGGSPRLVNVLCHKALMLAFSERKHEINTNAISQAITDTASVRGSVFNKWLIMGLSLGAIMLLTVLITISIL